MGLGPGALSKGLALALVKEENRSKSRIFGLALLISLSAGAREVHSRASGAAGSGWFGQACCCVELLLV